MLPTRATTFFLACSLACAQDLPNQEVPLAAKMSNASSLGTVSSIAADQKGVIYILQRGDKADPVIAKITMAGICAPGARACSRRRTVSVSIRREMSGPS